MRLAIPIEEQIDTHHDDEDDSDFSIHDMEMKEMNDIDQEIPQSVDIDDSHSTVSEIITFHSAPRIILSNEEITAIKDSNTII